MTRRIAVVTGSRAEYGLLRWVMAGIRDTPGLELQVIATGTHLSPEFGLTARTIEEDGFTIDRRVEMLLSTDTPAGIAKSMGLGMIGFADALRDLAPDLLIVLGDRFEIFSAVASALVARIPVAHLHGGEITEGAFDDAIRHAITKMSHLHFVAAPEYRNRVIQLGEDPGRVFVVGGLGIDSIRRLELLSRPELEAALGFQLGRRSLLVTFHPATLENESPASQMAELLAALEELEDTQLVFTMPNADTDGRALFGMLETYVASHSNARVFASLGQPLYLSCMLHTDGIVGNSSSALLEAPSFPKGAVNIGDRQRGRIRAANVIDCRPDRRSIAEALRTLYSPEFAKVLAGVKNPNGDGGASERVVSMVQSIPLDGLFRKSFHDLPVESSTHVEDIS